MLDASISRLKADVSSQTYSKLVAELENKFQYLSSEKCNDITGLSDFIPLHKITEEFYRKYYPDIFSNYIPLYHSLWKMRVKDASIADNIHQDGGVHHFSRNGYKSRMLTIWTNLYKDNIPAFSDDELGLFVVDSDNQKNSGLYKKMESENTHFFKKREGQLMDCMHVGGPVIHLNTDNLDKKYFDYEEGDSITFNSHLLHGTKSFSGAIDALTPEELNKFRVSLTSVWLHSDDLDRSVMGLPENDYESLYLSRQERELWPQITSVFGDACRKESNRIKNIKKLANFHLERSLASVKFS